MCINYVCRITKNCLLKCKNVPLLSSRAKSRVNSLLSLMHKWNFTDDIFSKQSAYLNKYKWINLTSPPLTHLIDEYKPYTHSLVKVNHRMDLTGQWPSCCTSAGQGRSKNLRWGELVQRLRNCSVLKNFGAQWGWSQEAQEQTILRLQIIYGPRRFQRSSDGVSFQRLWSYIVRKNLGARREFPELPNRTTTCRCISTGHDRSIELEMGRIGPVVVELQCPQECGCPIRMTQQFHRTWDGGNGPAIKGLQRPQKYGCPVGMFGKAWRTKDIADENLWLNTGP